MGRKEKNIIITLLFIGILTISIGYAAFQQRLNIKGVSNISSIYSVKFTNIVSDNNDTNASDKVAPDYTDTSATFSTNLLVPGDHMTYDITVSNLGTLDAKLLLITIDNAENDAIQIDYSGIKAGDILPAGQSIVVHVNVKYNHLITSQPDNVSSDFDFKMDFGQTDETTVEEIVNVKSRLKSEDYGLGESTSYWLDGPLMRKEIESINFTTTSIVPEDAGDNYWDVSNLSDNSVMAWYYDNDSDGLYEVTIGQYNGVKSNINSDHLFFKMSNLERLDTTNLDTSDATSMKWMFGWLEKLTYINIDNLSTSKVTNMAYMFYNLDLIDSLNVSNFDTSKVTDMSNMFGSCEKLSELDVSKWNTQNVKTVYNMFYGADSLESLDVSNWNTSKIENMSGMFTYSENLRDIDVSKWDTSKVTNMSDVFNGIAAEIIDVSNWNVSNVETMEEMFSGCSNVKTLDFSKWNTSKVTNMYGMLASTKIPLSDLLKLDVSNVEDMEYMLGGYAGSSILDLTSWDVTSATNMSRMFAGTSVDTINISNWNSINVTDMNSMFRYTDAVTVNAKNLKTSNVEDMSHMFEYASDLYNLDVSGWDTSNVITMNSMFWYNDSIKVIDISSWHTPKLEDTSSMFIKCDELTTIYASELWTTESITKGYSMFFATNKLVGAIPSVSSDDDSYKMANYETGYFTYKAYP